LFSGFLLPKNCFFFFMDEQTINALRIAKALLDEGILSQAEFGLQKARILQGSDERAAELRALVPGFASKILGTPGDGPGDKEKEKAADNKIMAQETPLSLSGVRKKQFHLLVLVILGVLLWSFRSFVFLEKLEFWPYRLNASMPASSVGGVEFNEVKALGRTATGSPATFSSWKAVRALAVA
jgi:hypothetical protein